MYADDCLDDITNTLSSAIPFPISFAIIHRPSVPAATSTRAPTVRAAEKAPALRSLAAPEGLEESDCVIWYLGEEGRSSLNLQMTHASNPVCRSLSDPAELTILDLRLLAIYLRHSGASSYIPLIAKTPLCPPFSHGIRRVWASSWECWSGIIKRITQSAPPTTPQSQQEKLYSERGPPESSETGEFRRDRVLRIGRMCRRGSSGLERFLETNHHPLGTVTGAQGTR